MADQGGGAMNSRRGKHVWIIEASYDRGPWYPTVGMALTLAQARRERHHWQTRNPDDRFRVVEYRSTR